VVTISHLPDPPPGKVIDRIDVVVRIRNEKSVRKSSLSD
jgi:hypothetical protein